MRKYNVGVLLKCKDEIELIKVMEELTDHGYEFSRIGNSYLRITKEPADSIRVIVKRPEDPFGEVMHVPNTLKAFQDLVGGYIEQVTVASDMALICNEEGRYMGLQPNPVAGVDFVGTVVAVGIEGDHFVDCPLKLHEWVLHWLGGRKR